MSTDDCKQHLADFLAAHPGIRQVEYVVTDPNGVARGKWGPVDSLEKAFSGGINFPLSIHGLDIWGNEVEETGLHISSGDRDGFFRAVPETLSAVPWGESDADGSATAQVLLETFTPDGEPFGGCARQVLRNAVERLAAADLSATAAFELEFYLYDGAGNPVQMAEDPQAQAMYSLEALADHTGFFADIQATSRAASLPVDTIVKEAAPGQYEINLTHRTDILRAADDVVLLKRIVRECARMHGLSATFMAKPVGDQPGSGMHIHASLCGPDGTNIFAGENGEAMLLHAVGGLSSTMAEMALVFINTANGFRRMRAASYAPNRINWGENNRSVALRLPAAPPQARRVEHRVAGADANPYLVATAIICGIERGLAQEIDPGPPVTGNAYEETTPHRGARLPVSMTEARASFAASGFARQALGARMVDSLVALKAVEDARFDAEITPLERSSYF